MAQEKNMAERYMDATDIGTVRIADDVVALIAAFAAMEVEGVSGMAGGLDMDTVSRGGMKRLGRTVKVEVGAEGVRVDLSIELVYGYSIPETCSKVQSKVRTAVENMTGLEVLDVNIRVAGIKMND
jgi:uncharacterized alkaline shock family protein YloU